MPRMQSSLRPTWTMFECQEAIAVIEAASLGPSKMPHPWMQAYSLPARLTPCRWTTWLPASRSWLPDTWRPPEGGGGGGGRGAGGGGGGSGGGGGGGGGGRRCDRFLTTPVSLECADVEPAPLRAVTTTRSLC